MSKIKQTEYVAFKCMDCGFISVFPNNKGDGNTCMKCNGYITPIGNVGVQNKHSNSITVRVSVDTTELDKAIEKAESLYKLQNDCKNIKDIIMKRWRI